MADEVLLLRVLDLLDTFNDGFFVKMRDIPEEDCQLSKCQYYNHYYIVVGVSCRRELEGYHNRQDQHHINQ